MMEMVKTMGPEALRQAGSNVTQNQVAQTNAEARMATAAPTDQPTE
jgi:hypothetical protein